MTEFDRTGLTRRRALALATGTAVSLAGCLSSPDDEGPPNEAASPNGGDGAAGPGTDGTVATDPNAGLDLPVDDSELERGAPEDAIPAIVDPVFGEDWSGVEVTLSGGFGVAPGSRPDTRTIEPRLAGDDPVVGVVREGEARAYPFRVLDWHEVVNDDFAGPLLVTYCPLCRSALTATRRVDGEMTAFGVSGLLYRNALVMYDEATESLWSQIAARAIQGPMTGEPLSLAAATITSWDAWRADHPGTTVLRPPPESGTIVGEVTRNYTRRPYDGYESSDRIGIGGREFDDDRLHPKAEVIGIANGDVARAYAVTDIEAAGLVEDTVGGLPVAVTTAPDGSPVAWVREVDGETQSFAVADERHLEADGSRWTRTTGVAVDGPHEGERLDQANAVSALFWFAWLDLHPETELYGTA